MHISRSTRQRVSRWMIGLLLLVQWLTSAYACPQGLQGAGRPAQEDVAAVVPADCHGMTVSTMDPENPALCKAHCETDRQAPVAKAQDDIPQPSLAAFLLTGPVRHDALPPPVVACGGGDFGGPPGWPPLYLIHRVLRN